MLNTICQTFLIPNAERFANMSSATKTLDLLSYFSTLRPEIGLSQLCRLARRDKATTYRHMQALEEAGFVEKNPLNKCYRLGPALLQLAQTRELTVPRKLGAQTPLVELANATGETAHVTVLSGNTVYPLASVESPTHSIRAIMDNHAFPLHATASGMCALAFGPEALQDVALENMPSFTQNTVTNQSDLLSSIRRARATGFGTANGSFEADVQGVAAPLFDQTGLFAGSVSVASVATRFTPTLARCVQQNLILASRNITRNWGGHIPDFIESAWAKPISPSNELEAAS